MSLVIRILCCRSLRSSSPLPRTRAKRSHSTMQVSNLKPACMMITAGHSTCVKGSSISHIIGSTLRRGRIHADLVKRLSEVSTRALRRETEQEDCHGAVEDARLNGDLEVERREERPSGAHRIGLQNRLALVAPNCVAIKRLKLSRNWTRTCLNGSINSGTNDGVTTGNGATRHNVDSGNTARVAATCWLLAIFSGYHNLPPDDCTDP
jgi:hypothetical protein